MRMESAIPASGIPVTCEALSGCDLLTGHWQALHDGGWPVRKWEEALPDLLRLAPELAPDCRSGWLDGLRALWSRHGWALRPAGRAGMLELAARWCDWPLVLKIGESLAESTCAHDALLLLEACGRLGKIEEALEISRRWQLLSPYDLRFPEVHEQLLGDLDLRRRFPAIAGEEFGEPELSLIPLAHRHAEDFFWQYFDPGIADLCCLPEFRAYEEWHSWRSGLYSAGDELPLAIIHREWGFLGCCHLVMHEGIGFLYYWLGRDFRGQGLAFRANRLLLSAASALFGLHTCYAKVFEFNAPSRRLLERLGFAPLDLRAIPDESEIFYRLGEDSWRVACELRGFLQRMKSDTSVDEPIYTEIKE